MTKFIYTATLAAFLLSTSGASAHLNKFSEKSEALAAEFLAKTKEKGVAVRVSDTAFTYNHLEGTYYPGSKMLVITRSDNTMWLIGHSMQNIKPSAQYISSDFVKDGLTITAQNTTVKL